jgi:hypothetical protein
MPFKIYLKVFNQSAPVYFLNKVVLKLGLRPLKSCSCSSHNPYILFQKWLGHDNNFTVDVGDHRCGVCGLRFERRAALVSHTNTCHRRAASVRTKSPPRSGSPTSSRGSSVERSKPERAQSRKMSVPMKVVRASSDSDKSESQPEPMETSPVKTESPPRVSSDIVMTNGPTVNGVPTAQGISLMKIPANMNPVVRLFCSTPHPNIIKKIAPKPPPVSMPVSSPPSTGIPNKPVITPQQSPSRLPDTPSSSSNKQNDTVPSKLANMTDASTTTNQLGKPLPTKGIMLNIPTTVVNKFNASANMTDNAASTKLNLPITNKVTKPVPTSKPSIAYIFNANKNTNIAVLPSRTVSQKINPTTSDNNISGGNGIGTKVSSTTSLFTSPPASISNAPDKSHCRPVFLLTTTPVVANQQDKIELSPSGAANKVLSVAKKRGVKTKLGGVNKKLKKSSVATKPKVIKQKKLVHIEPKPSPVQQKVIPPTVQTSPIKSLSPVKPSPIKSSPVKPELNPPTLVKSEPPREKSIPMLVRRMDTPPILMRKTPPVLVRRVETPPVLFRRIETPPVLLPETESHKLIKLHRIKSNENGEKTIGLQQFFSLQVNNVS